MAWLGVVEASYWAADFRVARLIHGAYQAAGRPQPVAVVGVSGPGEAGRDVGPLVAREMVRSYRTVFGLPERPVTLDQLPDVVGEFRAEFPQGFVVVVWGAPLPARLAAQLPAGARQGLVLGWSSRARAAEEEAEETALSGGWTADRLMAEALAACGRLPPHAAAEGAACPPPAAQEGHVQLIGLVEGPASRSGAPGRLQRMVDVLVDGILRFFFRHGILP